MNNGPTPQQVDALVRKIAAILHGLGPALQGAALCDLVSMYMAGHHPAMREETIALWVKTMRNLIPINEAQLFDRHGGRPEGWETE